MNLETAILSDSQTGKDKSHLCRLLKLYSGTYLQERERVTDAENKLMVARVESGWMGMTYTHKYV